MEIALPYVIVRICGPGVGSEIVAALSVHPVEVSEARDVWEMHRVSSGRPAILVVLADPPEASSAVVETRADLPGVPILVVSDAAEPTAAIDVAPADRVDTIRSGQPVQDICWHVLEAVGRAARLPGIAERPIGPDLIHIDETGIVVSSTTGPDGASAAGLRMRPGDSLLAVVEPLERDTIAHAVERALAGDTQFCATRFVDDRGLRRTVAMGLRSIDAGRVAVLVQPLMFGGPLIGRHVNRRDPITGLLTRWAMSRALEGGEMPGPMTGRPAVILLTLDDFQAISGSIGYRQTDAVLLGVASAFNQVFPYPVLTSRLMGDCFLAFMSGAADDEPLRRAERLLQILGDIEVPGFAPRFPLRGSIGVAHVTDGDHDLALRLAEAAAGEAHAAGGNRAVVAGTARFTSAQARDLTASMDLGAWEVWLQPVAGSGGRAEYHEALARFGTGHRHLASRADFFTVGQAKGLLERFDRMMLQRVLEMLESHPDARLAVNVSYETFVSESFPTSFLEPVRQAADVRDRIIMEIAPRCMAAPDELVRPRLETLAAAGVAVALDDFGSGICRLRYLTQWPLAIVKLDQLVTGYVDDDPLQRHFVRTVTSLCRARGITTVAEYTRGADQLARLVDDGVDWFQGEFFGMPRPAAEVLAPPVGAAPARGLRECL